MPVNEAFRKPISKTEARSILGIPTQAKVYMIMTGGIGCGDAISLCDTLLTMPDEDALIYVLAGRNEELLNGLNEKYGTDSKVRAHVPLVHTMMIPGVETENAEFFRTLGMSLVANSSEAAARYADRIVYDGKTGAKLMAAQRQHVPPDGAERIAAYITGNRA